MSVREKKVIQAPSTPFYQPRAAKRTEARGTTVEDFFRSTGLDPTILSKLPLGGENIGNRLVSSLNPIERDVLYETYGLYNYYLDIYYANRFEKQLLDQEREKAFNNSETRTAVEAKVTEYLDNYKTIAQSVIGELAEIYLHYLPSVYVRKRVELDRAISQVKEIGVSGTGAVCPRCNSTNFIHDMEQTRRGDEQATVKAKCADCGFQT